eukprot:g8872.t1
MRQSLRVRRLVPWHLGQRRVHSRPHVWLLSDGGARLWHRADGCQRLHREMLGAEEPAGRRVRGRAWHELDVAWG